MDDMTIELAAIPPPNHITVSERAARSPSATRAETSVPQGADIEMIEDK